MVRTKRFQRFIIYLGCFLFLLSFVGCGGKYKEDDIVYNNDFFTKELYQEIIEIHIMISSIDYHITDRDVIFNVYKELAFLPFEEYDQSQDAGLLGFTSFDLVTGDQTIQIVFYGKGLYCYFDSVERVCEIDIEVVERIMTDYIADWMENNLPPEEFKELGIKRE